MDKVTWWHSFYVYEFYYFVCKVIYKVIYKVFKMSRYYKDKKKGLVLFWFLVLKYKDISILRL